MGVNTEDRKVAALERIADALEVIVAAHNTPAPAPNVAPEPDPEPALEPEPSKDPEDLN